MTNFARRFGYENCVATKAKLERHKIAWALVGSMVLENVKYQKGGLNRKVTKFMSNYGMHISVGGPKDFSVGQKTLGEHVEFVVDSYGSATSNLLLQEVERFRVDLHGLKASPTKNAALIAKKEAEIGVLTRVLSMSASFNDAARMKEEVFAMQRQQFFGSGLLVRFSRSGLSRFVSGSDSGLVSLWSGSLVSFLDSAGSGPSAGTQGSATQDPHIAASDSSSDFDVMEGYPMQQHPESSSQDMHALGQQPGISMFSRLKETLSRATRSEHAINEINEGGGEVDSPFTSQIDPVLSESAHVSTPTTTPIGLSKLTPSETLLPDGRSLAEVQEVERYILAARKKEIESLRKAEQHRATLAKALMTSTNPLQSLELTTLKSQPIGSHIASGSKDTPNAAILDGVFLNENWEYNLQTEKLTDLYTSYTYHVGWLDVIQAISNSISVDEQQRMICDVIHSIVQMERQNLGINMPSMGPMRFLDTTKAKQPTISQMETPSESPMDPSYIVSPGVSMQSEPTHGSFSFPDLVQPSLGDLPTPTMNMTGGAPSTSLADTTPLHTSVVPLPIPIGVHQPYVPVATHPYVAPMPPPNPTAYVPQSHYPSPYFSGVVPAGINTSYPTSAIPEPTSTSFRPSLGAVPYEDFSFMDPQMR
ncbi:hypothetical protein L7F22_045263 [Adiantum nelumboides]|nr:hypothetical protein [Adiantum nelumboides]